MQSEPESRSPIKRQHIVVGGLILTAVILCAVYPIYFAPESNSWLEAFDGPESSDALEQEYIEAYEAGDIDRIRNLFRPGKSGEAGLETYLSYAVTGAGRCEHLSTVVRSYEETQELAPVDISEVQFDYEPTWFFEFNMHKSPTEQDPAELNYTIWLPAGEEDGKVFFIAASPL